jgi:hypothetical protein
MYIRPEKNRRDSRTSGSVVDEGQLVRECTTQKVVVEIKKSEVVNTIEKVVCLSKNSNLLLKPKLPQTSGSAMPDISEAFISDAISVGVKPKDKPKDPDKPKVLKNENSKASSSTSKDSDKPGVLKICISKENRKRLADNEKVVHSGIKPLKIFRSGESSEKQSGGLFDVSSNVEVAINPEMLSKEQQKTGSESKVSQNEDFESKKLSSSKSHSSKEKNDDGHSSKSSTSEKHKSHHRDKSKSGKITFAAKLVINELGYIEQNFKH